ncbi:MAG: prolipoprotein diacylglyceryl transferase [Novosphingobium sp. 32-60-15]|uniref:prolipoprotein diacylglyceryl transferase n=1 Tax=unclassified Novosphingobium TaxID=2644732 RepID=UPI000BD93B75|nr:MULTISPECIES: prolipoprotein diacylglyceryl transferase [unclassified Novosphingobium]OYX61982.1 MAG: prolipoprotein diacylglyceryl transferase [Novosphingobium sp. 32-60-15]
MLSLLSTATALAVASTSAAASAGAVSGPIRWEDLGVSPIALDLGFFALKWYSLAYLAGIILGYWQLSKMISQPGAPIAQRHADDLFFYATLGIILGGRLGYAMFYAPELLTEPQNLIKLWEGGMSFHGGLLGVVLAIAWVSWRAGLNFVRVCDYISVCVPFGLLFGRLANFMNGELWGREAGSGVAWAMIFPGGGPIARHPSQLYEAALEGLVLAIVLLFLFWRTKARWRTGLLVGTFTFGYALARFMVEFYREPDSQLQDFAMRTGFSMGQWLTIPMMAVGLFFLIRGLINKPVSATGAAPA